MVEKQKNVQITFLGSYIQLTATRQSVSSKQLILYLISLVLAASVISHTVNAVEPTAVPEFISVFGAGASNGSSTGPGLLSQPTDVAVDSSGNVYVSDAGNDRIQKFSNSGTFISQWGSSGSGNGQLDFPWGMAVDASDNIYVADINNNRIQKFSNNGTYITQWGSFGGANGQFWQPEAVGVDRSGNIYVTDNGNGRIQKFSSDGTYITQWGSFGSGNGQFSYPTGVVADSSGNVYVTDENQDRVQKFSSTGTYISQWGTEGTGTNQLHGPTSLAIDSADVIYVVDSYNNRISKFSTDGSSLGQWGSYGTDNGQFNYPQGIATDAAGDVFVVDTYSHRMQKFGYPKTAELETPSSNQVIELTTPATTTISFSDVVTEASLAQQDQANSYPLGLVDFRLTAEVGSAQQITLTFVTDLIPSDVTARKYDSSSNSFSDIPGAVITESTLDSKHALQLTYSITDGGTLDDDGLANGVIVDPVGLAVGNSALAPGAPSSGAGAVASLPIYTALIALPVLGYVVLRKYNR